ncbi:hypothetical protein K431DRAFT_282604 [Polychaeton citri CBS 116435]|uniref:Transport protein particle subunit trs85-2 n=1 Tax=Polychaeton citri CBS 116435 TaxID=1314669 RepID=A0A9P4QDZ7_9PEZI|nr:hypothetical protein K431DRAFT_282604 [Polychaeton citri CBS 116435]
MPSIPDDALQSRPASYSDSDTPVEQVSRPTYKRSPLPSAAGLPYRRSNNASFTSLFAATTPTTASRPGTATPTGSNGSVFSPGGSTVVAGSARSNSPSQGVGAHLQNTELKELILRAFAPHVSILASQDTEELVRHKGVNGGTLDLLRPFGEHVQGKVTIRDSTGVSRSWEDYSIKFMGVRDGLENPRPQSSAGRSSIDSSGGRQRASVGEFKPARLRTGGDVAQVDDLVERHLTFAEEHSAPQGTDYINPDGIGDLDPHTPSPFYQLFLRRLLSAMPMAPSETLSHPVASVIMISSRNPAPIEEFRNLYASSNDGDHRLPQWVHNEFLRYYVLVHDEDYDDITKTMSLFDQMKRHFGLHCHLLRLRSKPCSPGDPNATQLPACEWTAAAEDLAEIVRRETMDDDDEDLSPTPAIFESDAHAIRAFIRELVTQSIIPSMERASATWNDQVASRRRGLSGRFMSLSKRFTFGTGGGSGNRPSSGLGFGGGGSNSNYDSLQGFYRPDSPEAIMRKLGDYALMLRDWKLAYSTFEVLCQDFKTDKAWRYYAGANEMAVVSSLLAASSSFSANAKIRVDTIDNYMETAFYSYITRANAPYNALRTLLLGIELLKMRGGLALDEAAKWCTRILDDRLVGPIGHALVMERVASCFYEHRGIMSREDRNRKAAYWNTLAADAWLRMEKTAQAEKCLNLAVDLYKLDSGEVRFDGMESFLKQLKKSIEQSRPGSLALDSADVAQLLDEQDAQVETLQQTADQVAALRSSPVMHRKSLSTAAVPPIQGQHTSAPGRRTSLQPSLPGIPAALMPNQAMPYDPLGSTASAYEHGDTVEPLSPSTGSRSPVLGQPPMSPIARTGSHPSGNGYQRGRDDGFS